MKLLKKLYNHPTLSDEVGAKRINRASIIMMMLFAPLLIISLTLAVLTTKNIFVVVQSGVWFVLVSFASIKVQTGSNSARKGMMIISVMNLLGGVLLLSIGGEFLLLGYSIILVASSAYAFFLMWGNHSVMKELSARRKKYSKLESTE